MILGFQLGCMKSFEILHLMHITNLTVSTSEQNDVAERNNWHILKVTRCLLFEMNVPRYLWGETVYIATYLINRIPLRMIDFSTPLEMVTETTSFKVPPKKFGCMCFVHNISLGISKLHARAHKCVFVGYSGGKRGYRCYDSVNKKMFESMDVTFRETESYFTLSDVQSNVCPVTFQDLLEVVVTLPSDRVSREGEYKSSDQGVTVIDTMILSPSPTTTTDLEPNMDQNLPPPNRQIHNVYTRKPHHENAEQLLDQDQYQLPSPVDGSSTPQPSGNSELPSDTSIFFDLDLSITIRKRVRSTVLKQEDGASTSHPISLTTSHLRYLLLIKIL
jgi:hypothetical protein